MSPSRPLLALALLATVVAPAGPAAATSHRAQLTYTCATAATKHEDQAVDYPFVTAVQLDVPATVKPGDKVVLTGTFSVQLPEKLRSLAAQYFTHAQAVSDSLTIPVVVGGRTTVLRASHFDSGKVVTKSQPLVLSGAVSAEPFTVPTRSSGSLRVELPANGTVPSNIDGSKVAFTAEALLSGGLVASFVKQYVYKVACKAPAGAQRTIATVPVATPAKPVVAPKGPKGSGPSTAAIASPTAGATPTATATPGSTGRPSGRPSAAVPSAPTTSQPGVAADAAPSAAVPERHRDDGTPAWPFAVGALVLLTGLGGTVWFRRRTAP